jgi:hypothetical protein
VPQKPMPKKQTKGHSEAKASQRKIAKGMRPLPKESIVPSSALEREGHRSILERLRKVQ